MTAFDPSRAPAALRRPEVVDAIAGLLLGDCDLCAEVGISKPASCERRIGQVHASVCEAHAYRIDSAKRARSARLAAMRGAS